MQQATELWDQKILKTQLLAMQQPDRRKWKLSEMQQSTGSGIAEAAVVRSK